MNPSEQDFWDCNWFAVHTKRFREVLAGSGISALGVEVFLPMIKVNAPDPGPIRVNSKPLFPAYLFARFSPAAFLDSVGSAPGVLYVVRSGPHPISVDDTVITEIQARVEDDGLIRLCPRKLAPGDRVSIESGPFAGMMGRVEAELDDHRRVAILLEALWSSRVLLEKRYLEVQTA